MGLFNKIKSFFAKQNRQRVVIESPYAGDIEGNVAYARRAVRDSLLRGEVPFASHLLYTQPDILNDNDTEERALGIQAGFDAVVSFDKTVVYCDLGISEGMHKGIIEGFRCGRRIEYRNIGK